MREHALHRGALGDDGEHAKSTVTLASSVREAPMTWRRAPRTPALALAVSGQCPSSTHCAARARPRNGRADTSEAR
jgi:hypothetical protein